MLLFYQRGFTEGALNLEGSQLFVYFCSQVKSQVKNVWQIIKLIDPLSPLQMWKLSFPWYDFLLLWFWACRYFFTVYKKDILIRTIM